MVDTNTAYTTGVTNTTIANGSTWTSFTFDNVGEGLYEFTDVQGNKVRSRQHSLVKFIAALRLAKLS
jgi:hypothetical protein